MSTQNISNVKVETPAISNSKWKLSESIGRMSSRIVKETRKGITSLAEAKNDAGLVTALLKKSHNQVLPAFPAFKEANVRIGHVVPILELLDIVNDADYLLNKRYKQDNAAGIAGHILSPILNVSGIFAWLNDVGLLKLGAIAAKIGEVRVFGFVGKLESFFVKINMPGLAKAAASIGNARVFGFITKIPVGTVLGAGLGVMHTFFAFDAIDKFIAAGDYPQEARTARRVSAALSFTASAMDIAFVVLAVASAVNGIALAALGLTAIGVIVTKYVWDKVHKEELAMKALPKSYLPARPALAAAAA